MTRLGFLILVALALPLSAVWAQPATLKSADTDVPVAWFELSLELVRETPGFSPPVASRAFGYLGVTFYEAVVPGLPGYRTLAGQLNGLGALPEPNPDESYYWPAVANAALARMTTRLFATATPENSAAMRKLEVAFAEAFAAEQESRVLENSIKQGQAVADAIYAWSRSDGGHEGYARNFPEDYYPSEGAGLWVSTPPAFDRALQPTWGQNRPFVLYSAEACPVAPPPTFSQNPVSEFYQQALEVYEKGRALTDEERTVAQFWADDPSETATPPGHWVSILNQVLSAHDYGLGRVAEVYAKLGIALADAFIACWHAKYQYNLIRPITYIQQIIDPEWNRPSVTDVVLTPSFPEYPSGHSVQSSAAAQVLTDVFGQVAFTDHTHDARGLKPRSYPSFFAAAEEAAVSRLYGGIHYRAAIENGLAQGRCIGEKVSALQIKESF